MNNRSKLRMSVGLFYPIAIISCYILAIAEWGIRSWLIGEGMDIKPMPFFTYYICSAFFIGMGIFQWFKYRLWVNPVIGIIVGFLCIQGPALIINDYFFTKASYFATFFILGLVVILNWSTLYGQERYEINARRLLKLAAEQIFETIDGFTDRPFSAGQINASKEELLGFSRFMEGKYVTRVFHEDSTIFLAFSLNRSLLTVVNPRDVSHIAIFDTGTMTIFISEADYRQYRKTYNFNQLCHSLGEVVKRFMGYYQEGLEGRIITELKTAR
ncbi:MAG: hypothetical protein IH596_10950 [Bacteroidales bacterium]|nr:hypothetical protein [Bacteroidales bacterium]